MFFDSKFVLPVTVERPPVGWGWFMSFGDTIIATRVVAGVKNFYNSR